MDHSQVPGEKTTQRVLGLGGVGFNEVCFETRLRLGLEHGAARNPEHWIQGQGLPPRSSVPRASPHFSLGLVVHSSSPRAGSRICTLVLLPKIPAPWVSRDTGPPPHLFPADSLSSFSKDDEEDSEDSEDDEDWDTGSTSSDSDSEEEEGKQTVLASRFLKK